MMAAASSRAVQMIKPHVPLIKFPNRKMPQTPATGSSGPVKQTLSVPQASYSVQGEYIPPSKLYPTYSKPVGYTQRGSGIDMKDLPSKYRRLPIEQEEIEYIQRGGPA